MNPVDREELLYCTINACPELQQSYCTTLRSVCVLWTPRRPQSRQSGKMQRIQSSPLFGSRLTHWPTQDHWLGLLFLARCYLHSILPDCTTVMHVAPVCVSSARRRQPWDSEETCNIFHLLPCFVNDEKLTDTEPLTMVLTTRSWCQSSTFIKR